MKRYGGEEGNQSKDNKKKSLAVLCEYVPKLQSLMDQLDLTLSVSFTFLIRYNSKVIKTVMCQRFVFVSDILVLHGILLGMFNCGENVKDGYLQGTQKLASATLR